MQITKRNGSRESYDKNKIKNAIRKAFISVQQDITEEALDRVATDVEEKVMKLAAKGRPVQVELIQDFAEITLMEHAYFEVAKSYIIYRVERKRKRELRKRIVSHFHTTESLDLVLKEVQEDYPQSAYDLERMEEKFLSFYKPGMSETDSLAYLVRSAAELTKKEAPKWEYIAARLDMMLFTSRLAETEKSLGIGSFYEKLELLTDRGLYAPFILQNYSRSDVEELVGFIDEKRNQLLNYSGLQLLMKRYVIHSHSNQPLESVQEMFLGIAMHLAMKEATDRNHWVKKFYDMLSKLQVTMATPTLSNARKPFHQLSSCFIDTVPDSLDGIYRSIDNFAKVSKFGGGMGMYFGKVRAKGSTIRGFEGAAGGVIRWIRLANDTAVAVDQLGVRQGAVAVYLDVWHKDLPEFLGLRTNNGDDRMKAHDVFPAVCYPDYFWKMVKEDIEGDWYLMCPHDIWKAKGYRLEDCFGEEWERKYQECISDERIAKRVIPIKEIVRMVIKSAVETGTPFTFNRDHVNRLNPNGDKGMIYCSNLCTEIAQNMSEIEMIEQRIETVDGEEVVVTVTKPGDFVVCNLASLSLGNIDVTDRAQLEDLTATTVRALDNVIDLNFFPLPYAKINNEKYRPIGLGVSGYHHMLAKHRIEWESQAHLDFVDEVFETINYAAIKTSHALALEKGRYHHFEGSDWQTGSYFEKRGYTSAQWQQLKDKIATDGVRNGYLMAIAPTSSTSIIAGTTAGIDPIMSRYFLEEKKKGLIPRVAPELTPETFWYYENAHNLDQSWSIRACGVRSRHVDQAQSMNMYITNNYTFRQVLDLFLLAWEEGVKTIYYFRSKSLEVEECDVCSS